MPIGYLVTTVLMAALRCSPRCRSDAAASSASPTSPTAAPGSATGSTSTARAHARRAAALLHLHGGGFVGGRKSRETLPLGWRASSACRVFGPAGEARRVELRGAQHAFDRFDSLRHESLIDGIEAFARRIRA